MSKEDTKDSRLILAGFNKQEAEDAAFKQLMEMYNNTNPEELDVPLLEYVLRNAFLMGCHWSNIKKEDQ